MGPIPYGTLQKWKHEVNTFADPFIALIPKVELHVHIEGTLTPELRFKLGQRNHVSLTSRRLNRTFSTLSELKDMYNLLEPRSIKGSNQISAFFDAYYGGMEVLRTYEDFYELAMEYFCKASQMNVQYCEPFFDPQAHTRRGIAFKVFMKAFKNAQIDAERNLNVKSQWIMCILRDLPLESAMEHYEIALKYKDVIVGIGLDSNEYDRPPSIFEPLFLRAREDGFKLTCHCDVTQKDTHEHIRQVVECVGGTGADRLDHGLDAAQSPELIALIKQKAIGVTLCPWAYVRHHTEEDLFAFARKLFDAQIRINISSDSPAYVESNWITQNLGLLKMKAGFTNAEIVRVETDSVKMSWATDPMKREIVEEIENFWAENMGQS